MPRLTKEKTDALQAILDILTSDQEWRQPEAIWMLKSFIEDCGFRKGDRAK